MSAFTAEQESRIREIIAEELKAYHQPEDDAFALLIGDTPPTNTGGSDQS